LSDGVPELFTRRCGRVRGLGCGEERRKTEDECGQEKAEFLHGLASEELRYSKRRV